MTVVDTATGQVFADVWDALEDDPIEAGNLRMRSDLMDALEREIASWGLSQRAAARRLGISQPRLNDLLRSRINYFSLDGLLKIAASAGLRVHLHVQVPAAPRREAADVRHLFTRDGASLARGRRFVPPAWTRKEARQVAPAAERQARGA